MTSGPVIRVGVAALVGAAAVVAAVPADAQQRSVVTAGDVTGDAYGYAYVDSTHDVNAPGGSPASDPRADVVRLTAVATSTGVRLSVRLAAPVAAGEDVWVALTTPESDCTIDVLVSDYPMNGRNYTALANWCGEGVTVNSVWRPDVQDPRPDEPTAFVPYSAFPQVVPTHGPVAVRAETMRDVTQGAARVARTELDGLRASAPLQLLGRR